MNQDLQVDRLLQAAGRGDRDASELAWQGLYRQLHEIATRQMASERSNHLLQTTAIVHEAYFRLSDQETGIWESRDTFFAAAAVVMRRVLVDHARSEKSKKRGGQVARAALSSAHLAVDDRRFEAVEIDEALTQLAEFDPQQARALELMIFGGLSGAEVAGVIGVSESTIDRRIRAAKAWLRRKLHDC